jgi:hypothetical protein
MPKKKKGKKNPAAQALSALRMKKISPKRRKEIAEKAIAARWAKKKESSSGTGSEGHPSPPDQNQR